MIGFRRYPPLTRRPEFYRARADAKKVRDVNYNKRTDIKATANLIFLYGLKLRETLQCKSHEFAFAEGLLL